LSTTQTGFYQSVYKTTKRSIMNNSLPKTRSLSILLVVAAFFFCGTAFSQVTWDRGAFTNNWGDANNWSTNAVPTATDAVIIPDLAISATINVNVAANCLSLTINGGGFPVSMTVNSAITLNVTNAVAMNAPNLNDIDKVISLAGTGILNCGSLTMANVTAGNTNTDIMMNVNNGTLNVGGGITMSGSSGENFINLTGTGVFEIGTTISGGTISAAVGSVVKYDGAAAQAVEDYAYDNLTLSGAGTKTLNNNPTTIPGNLLIEAGATLSLGNEDFEISLNGDRSATINGRLNINGNGRLTELGTGTKTLILGSAGYLSITDVGGSTLPAYNAFTFNATSTVEYGASDAQTVENTPTYGNLIVSGGNTKTLETTAGTMTFAGSITIGTGTTLASNNKTMNVGRSWSNSGTFTQGTSTVVLNGAAAQTLGSGSNATTFNNLTFANTIGGITLSKPATISGAGTFTNGIVNTDATNILIFADNATSSLVATTDEATLSYVRGPVRKVGNDAFTFPIGGSTGFVPLSITVPDNAADAFTAQYFRGTPVENTDITVAGINHLSACDYWELAEAADAGSNTSITATMYWNQNNPCNPPARYVDNPATIRGVRYISNSWSAASAAAGTGTNSDGSVAFASISYAALNTFVPMTLGSTLSTTNPLPVRFTDVKAYQKGSGVQIDWSNLTESELVKYVVERSADGQSFVSVGEQSPRSNQASKESYSKFDASPLPANFYRVTAIEFSGKTIYSKILRVDIGTDTKSIAIYPNPTRDKQVSVSMNTRKGLYILRIFNSAGQEVMAKQLNHAGGALTQTVELPAAVKPGVYNILISGDNYRESKTFLVQ
jgi:hypothetical protein